MRRRERSPPGTLVTVRRRRRRPARGRDVQPAHAARRSTDRPRRRASRSAADLSHAASSARYALRQRLFAEPYYRLVHAESDGAAGPRHRPVRRCPGHAGEHRRHRPARAGDPRRTRRYRRAAGDRAAQRQPGARPGGAAGRDPGRGRNDRGAGSAAAKTIALFRPICSADRRPVGFSTSAATAPLSPAWLGMAGGCSTSTATPADLRCRRREPGRPRRLGSTARRRRWRWRPRRPS